jgi:hypothetical protein
MRRSILIIFSAFLFFSIQAQTGEENASKVKEKQEIQTIFSNPVHLGWWVSPEFSYTQFDGKDVYLAGFSGGVILNHSFSIGFTGYGITNSQSLDYSEIADTSDLHLFGGYGGLKLEYRIKPMKMINIAFPLLIGGSGMSYMVWDMDNWMNDPHHEHIEPYAWDSNFVIEPGVMVGINVVKFMRFDAGVSYRYAPGLDLPKTDSNILNGFNATVSLKFGKF